MDMNNFLTYLHNRLKEPSTYRGLVSLAMALGIGIHPEMIEQIIAVGVTVLGLILTFKKDARSPDAE